MVLAERGHKKMGPEKVKDMTTAGRKSRVRDLIKSGQMKKLIYSLPPTIISSFTGARGKNILYLDPPGINLTSTAGNAVLVLAGSCGPSAGGRNTGPEAITTARRDMASYEGCRAGG